MLVFQLVLVFLILLLLTYENSGHVLPNQLKLPSSSLNDNIKTLKDYIINTYNQCKNDVELKLKFNAKKGDNNKFVDRLEDDNNEALKLVNKIISSKDGWEYVNTKDDVIVEKRFLPAGKFVEGKDAAKGGKHACVKSVGILNASPESLYKLFLDNSRVSEYNEHCETVKDIEYYPRKNSKIVWACSPKYGPFKARDFCSVVNYIKSSGGKYIILNRPAYHKSYPPSNKYVRATILLAANIIEPCGKGKSKLTQIAHLNPGGAADNSAAAWIINQLCAVGPPTFMKKLEKAARKK